jgi:hypothetical protein
VATAAEVPLGWRTAGCELASASSPPPPPRAASKRTRSNACGRTTIPKMRRVFCCFSVQANIRARGGFEGCFFGSFSSSLASVGVPLVPVASGAAMVRQFSPAVYRVLLEIALDCLTRPSDAANTPTVETFGKILVRPQLLRPIFKALPVAESWQLSHDVMKAGSGSRVHRMISLSLSFLRRHQTRFGARRLSRLYFTLARSALIRI